MIRRIVQRTMIAGCLTAVTLGAPTASLAQEATPAACPTTTEEENAALIADFYAAINADKDVSAFYTDDHTVHVQRGVEVEDGGPTWFGERLDDIPDLELTPVHILTQDDMVATYTMWSGTHEGADETLGIPATGEEAEWVAASFFRIECGAIAELWPITDTFGITRDLGVITDEELQSVDGEATPAP